VTVAEEKAEKNEGKVAQKPTEKEVAEPGCAEVEKSQTTAESVPIPYPNIDQAEDTSSGGKTVKTNGKEVSTKGASFTKSTGDEPGHSTWRSLTEALKEANTYKILEIPVWIWGVGLIVLLAILYVLASNTLRPTAPVEEHAFNLIP